MRPSTSHVTPQEAVLLLICFDIVKPRQAIRKWGARRVRHSVSAAVLSECLMQGLFFTCENDEQKVVIPWKMFWRVRSVHARR